MHRCRMSWKGWGKPWRKGTGTDGYAAASSYYSSSSNNGKGSWAEDWQGYNKKDHKKEDAKHRFPGYNQQQQDIVVVAEQKNQPPAGGTEEDAIKEIQRAVNAARKAEQRVVKIQADLRKGQMQWQGYEQALKKAYAAEKTKFHGDQSKLRQELVEAIAAQSSTRAALRAAAVGQLQDDGREETHLDVDMDESWMALMQDRSYVEATDQAGEFDGWLQTELTKMGSPRTTAAAKARLAMALQGETKPSGGDPTSTPKRPTCMGVPSPTRTQPVNELGHGGSGPKALFPFGCRPGSAKERNPEATTQATQYRGDSPAVSDPYLVSPSNMQGHLPDTGVLLATPPTKHRKSPRTSIKELARPKGPASTTEPLADKLLAARTLAAKDVPDLKPANPLLSPLIDDDHDHLGVPIPSGSDLDLMDG